MNLAASDIVRPGPSLPDFCPCVQTEAEAWKVAWQFGDSLDRIEQYRDGLIIRLEGVPEGERPNGDLLDFVEPTLPPKLAEMNDRLAAKGLNIDPVTRKGMGLSPWWRKQVSRMYFARKLNPTIQRNEVVVRGGRRSGKSITICLVSLYETLYGDHVPTLDTSVFTFLSAERPQAKERINTIGTFCKLLGMGKEEADPQTERVRFPKLNRMIEAHTASLTSVVSMTSHGACCDEEALWKDEKDGSNPAELILEQLRPTMSTQQNAWLFHVSAPWSTLDAHHRAFERGTDSIQFAWHCPSWVGNPTLTKEGCARLTRDQAELRRQYYAIPLSSAEEKFFPKPFIDMARGIT